MIWHCGCGIQLYNRAILEEVFINVNNNYKNTLSQLICYSNYNSIICYIILCASKEKNERNNISTNNRNKWVAKTKTKHWCGLLVAIIVVFNPLLWFLLLLLWFSFFHVVFTSAVMMSITMVFVFGSFQFVEIFDIRLNSAPFRTYYITLFC